MLVKGLLSERHGLASCDRCSRKSSSKRLGFFLVQFLVVSAQCHLALCGCLSIQEAALLDRAAGLDSGNRSAVSVAWSTGAAVGGGCQVGDVFGDRVLRANGAGVVALASLGHGIVARVEVFAVLQVLGEVVGS